MKNSFFAAEHKTDVETIAIDRESTTLLCWLNLSLPQVNSSKTERTQAIKKLQKHLPSWLKRTTGREQETLVKLLISTAHVEALNILEQHEPVFIEFLFKTHKLNSWVFTSHLDGDQQFLQRRFEIAKTYGGAHDMISEMFQSIKGSVQKQKLESLEWLAEVDLTHHQYVLWVPYQDKQWRVFCELQHSYETLLNTRPQTQHQAKLWAELLAQFRILFSPFENNPADLFAVVDDAPIIPMVVLGLDIQKINTAGQQNKNPSKTISRTFGNWSLPHSVSAHDVVRIKKLQSLTSQDRVKHLAHLCLHKNSTPDKTKGNPWTEFLTWTKTAD